MPRDRARVGHARARTRSAVNDVVTTCVRDLEGGPWILTLAGTYREDCCKAHSALRSELVGESIHIFIVHLEQEFLRHLKSKL